LPSIIYDIDSYSISQYNERRFRGGLIMSGVYDEIIAEVRHNRECLLRKYGGIDGLHKHMDEERPILEKAGWKFVTDEEMFILQHRNDEKIE
jgi:hypothetical protein